VPDRRLHSLALGTGSSVRSACALARHGARRTSHFALRTSHFSGGARLGRVRGSDRPAPLGLERLAMHRCGIDDIRKIETARVA
jgi:hypothetical protein